MKAIIFGLTVLYNLFLGAEAALHHHTRSRFGFIGVAGNHCHSPTKEKTVHLCMSSEYCLQSISFITTKSWSPDNSRDIILDKLYPPSEYNDRMNVGRDAQFGNQGGRGSVLASSVGSMDANDPRLSLTYHEFPLNSMDQLISLASLEFKLENGREPAVLVDLGSGCGRLVFYSAMQSRERGENNNEEWPWKEVHGVEISSLLHSYAEKVAERGVGFDYFQKAYDGESMNGDSGTMICLHQGPANQYVHVFNKADIIFCYSTVFSTDDFDQNIGAMILSKEWSQMLSNACKRGTVVITTDRALNPSDGWEFKQSLEVENKSLMGSVGYISVKI